MEKTEFRKKKKTEFGKKINGFHRALEMQTQNIRKPAIIKYVKQHKCI